MVLVVVLVVVVVVFVTTTLLPFAIEFDAIALTFDAIALTAFEAALIALAAVLSAVLALLIAFVLLALLAAVFVLAVSPQAIPNAPNAKRDESAITFLILIDLLSSTKNIFTYFYRGWCYTALFQYLKFIFGTFDNIDTENVLVNLKNRKK